MSEPTKLASDRFVYLNSSKNKLDNLEVKRNSKFLQSLRQKWTKAAIITLASGSAILFSANHVKADSKDPESAVSTQEVQENQDTQSESNNQNPTELASEGQTADKAGQKDVNGVELPANHQDHVKGNVQSAWDQGYQGEHMAVAVIDSGIDVDHKDFQTMPKDPKFTANEMKEKIRKLGYGRYVNEKIPYAYNYVDNENEHLKGPDSSPHGQHVSGTIAANGHPDGDKEYVVGVAPQAQLMHLKVFGDTTTSLDIAKEIYDAVDLGADVIQMSLGGGVSAADLNNVDQRAVQYAIDHGVVVSISASNNGNAASVDNPSRITDLTDYQPGGERGNYLPFSSSTVANPGAARNALTVAAETSGMGKDSDMAYFTSWGPLPDYTLKPDVSAPGYQVISTANNNGYTVMSGTSMAGPFAAGAALLVKQRLQKTNPELKGAALVAAVKALIMNTANPQTQRGFNTPVSPRRQGAGQINVGAATRSPVYITAADGTGSLSLRQVSDGTEFELTFHNLSNQVQSYTFDDMGGGFTEVRDETTGLFHDVQLAGAYVSGDHTIELTPNETKAFKFMLNLAGLKQNQLVEGFLNFKNNKDQTDLVVPYLGYYGDMTNEDVFDQKANSATPDIQGNRLVNEDNYPRGIADEESLKALVNVDGTYNWQEVAKLYESGKVAFSPDGNNKSDLLKPVAFLKQNLEDLRVEILDANGKVVRVLSDNHGPEKSYHDDHSGMLDLSRNVNNSDTLEWDGKLYDKTTGKMITAPDGHYTYRFVATLYNNGAHKVQTNDTSVIIDTTAPVLNNVDYDATTYTLSGDYADSGAGFTNYSYATVTVNDHVFGFKLNDGNKSKFVDADKTKGRFSFTLTPEQQEALAGVTNKITLAISDVADNTVVQTVDAAPVVGHQKVAIWNAINGLPFNKESVDYNAKRNMFMLRGAADKDFYVNGKWVQVDHGQFIMPVDVNEQNFVFSSDQVGKNILGKFTTFTPKAQFAWQHVDGEEKSFGIKIYSIEGKDPKNITVQAAVPKGENIKAFAKDYFTGEVYTGEVKDGVATFHVHTSINKDAATGIFLRALLQGWVEVNGPTFNAKQVTDPNPISDANYIGVYYNPLAVDNKGYANRDDLGVNFNDEAADINSFGPRKRSNSNKDESNIHFDYLSNNGIAILGHEAVDKGYYDPKTQRFTLTGQVDPSVISLTFLADSPYEVDPENQADIHDNGKFSVTFRIGDPATRQLSYFYKTTDGKTTRGSLTLILDTIAPTLKVDQLGDRDELEVTTNKPIFRLSGEANDNLDGFNVFINGDNVFGQFGNSGYNYLPGLYGDPDQTTPNLYGSYKFDQEEQLDDQNGQATTHIFTLVVVDQAGNKTQKKITVHYDPNYHEASKSGNQDQSKSDQVAEEQDSHSDEQTVSSNEDHKEPVTKEIESNKGGDITNNKDDKQSDQTSTVKNDVEKTVLADQDDKKQDTNQLVDDSAKDKPLSKKPTTDEHHDNLTTYVSGVGQGISSSGESVKLDDSVQSSMQQTNTQVDDSASVSTLVSEYSVADSTMKKFKLVKNAYGYTAKGTRITKNGKKLLFKKGKYILAWNNGKVVTIKGRKYYRVAKDIYVRIDKVKQVITLKRDTFVYNRKENRVKLGNYHLLRKGKVLPVLNNGKVVTIKGNKYYQVGKNQFVKVEDAKFIK